MKVASRYLLPLEMFIGLGMIGWGLSGYGVFLRGGLYRALQAAEHTTEWALVFTTLGLAMTLVALIEWTWGKHATMRYPTFDVGAGPGLAYQIRKRLWIWNCARVAACQWLYDTCSSDAAIMRSSSARATIAFLSAGAWIAGLVVVMNAPKLHHIAVLAWTAPLHIVWCFWIYKENLKVRYALSSEYSTSKLHFSR